MPRIWQVPIEEMVRIAPLFYGWTETLIWSCLQGIMGRAWTDDLKEPRSAQIQVGDFCFFAGHPHEGLAAHIAEDCTSNTLLLIPQHEGWQQLLQRLYPQAKRQLRYALQKDPTAFDREKLAEFAASLPACFTVRPIDEELYVLAGQEEWSRDLCSQFPTYTHYSQRGLGYMVLKGSEPVCGASSYTVYDGGIEIQIDTKESFRRQGLALSCGARLILTCLEHGLYPSWDAATPISLHLAEKLGYKPAGTYPVYALDIPL